MEVFFIVGRKITCDVFYHGKNESPLRSIGYLLGFVAIPLMLYTYNNSFPNSELRVNIFLSWISTLVYAVNMILQICLAIESNLRSKKPLGIALFVGMVVASIQLLFYILVFLKYMKSARVSVSVHSIRLCALVIMNAAFEMICIYKTSSSAVVSSLKIFSIVLSLVLFATTKIDCIGYVICGIASISSIESFATRVSTGRRWHSPDYVRLAMGIVLMATSFSLFMFEDFFSFQRLMEIKIDPKRYDLKTKDLEKSAKQALSFIKDFSQRAIAIYESNT